MSTPTLAPAARLTVGQVVKGDHVFLNGAWPTVVDIQRAPAGRRRVVLSSGSRPILTTSAPIMVRHTATEAPAAEPVDDHANSGDYVAAQILDAMTETPATVAAAEPEPTNPQSVTVAEFKRALVPGSRWLVTNHYINREDHPSFGTTKRTVARVTGSHYYLPIEGKDDATGIAMPERGQVRRADGGIFLVYGGGAGRAADELFLTLRPQA